MKRTIRKGGTVIGIEDYAFYIGAQGIPAKDGLEEIEHRFAQEKSKLEAVSVQKQKPLEAILERSAILCDQVTTAWEEARTQLGYHAPPVIGAYAILALGPVALLVDTVLTGPSLDALNISEPVVQYVSAFAIAAVAAIIFHLVLESFEAKTLNTQTRWGYRALGVFALVGLTSWGLLRGYEVAFGAEIAGNPLGRFLGGHFLLASVVFCFITVGAPLGAAFSVGHAADKIHKHRHWHHARREHQQLTDTIVKAKKALEEGQHQLRHSLRTLDSERREWQACFSQYYQRGVERGGRQEPAWTVPVKAAAVGLAATAIAVPLGMLFWPLYLLPLATGITAFVHFRRTRHSPSYQNFRKHEVTHFTVTHAAQPQLQFPKPRIIDALPSPSKENRNAL